MKPGFSPPRPEWRFSLECWLIGAIALGILLRLLHLSSRELWYDEALSLLLFSGQKLSYQTPPATPIDLNEYTQLLNIPGAADGHSILLTLQKLLRGIVGSEPHPPLFFVSQHFWLRLFGKRELAMRSLNALLSGGAIASSYGLGRVLLGHRAGLTLAALMATNPFYLFHSLNVRMYAPLVLWTVLATGSLFKLIQTSESSTRRLASVGWSLVLMGAVAAGLLTFYLFAYMVIALAVLGIYLDRRHGWQHGLRLGIGCCLTLPWMVWGFRQQLRNADFQRFTTDATRHDPLHQFQAVARTVGNQLILGDWGTSLPTQSDLIAGTIAIALLTVCALQLWRKARPLLTIALILSVLPLGLALITDLIANRFTVGFGYGRSLIYILPGLLLLIVIWLEQTSDRCRAALTGALLVLYLTVSMGDYSLRQRHMFRTLAEQVNPVASTLVVMNTQAWGHVARLAYYLPSDRPIALLAQPSSNLASALAKTLSTNPKTYTHILWLESAVPLWSPPTTDEERQHIQQLLSASFQLTQAQTLTGTMDLDQFTVRLYE